MPARGRILRIAQGSRQFRSWLRPQASQPQHRSAMNKTPPRVIRAAFDQGDVPTIAVFNKATTPLGVPLDKLIAAMQKYVDLHVAPVWGTRAKLVKSTG